jgi:flagellar biosynthetic protein FliO
MNDSFPTTLIFTIVALALVLTLAWLIVRFLAGLGNRIHSGTGISIQSSQPVSTRSKLLVIRYREHDYLLGVSPEQINLIDKHPATNTNGNGSSADTPVEP